MQSAPSSYQVRIRAARPEDLSEVVRLHLELLPHGFFARLGQGYLRVYHRSFMTSPFAVSLVAYRDDRLVGFVAGALDAHRHQQWTLRRLGSRLLVRGLFALTLRPQLAWEFLTTRTGRYVRGVLRAVRPAAASPTAATTDDSVPEGPVAVLTHVAVDPSDQGRGSGSALVDSFVQRVSAVGTARIELVTLCDDGASPFYERLGWSAVGEHEREGARFRRFTLDLA